uniref:Saccharopine dehydrogenase n=1 Tax=Macrostomum lignano TaxID=282301 RepID=A0A1I8HYP0_9PLAT
MQCYHYQARRLFGNFAGRGNAKKVLAIRRETINLWERRAPLSPNHVRKLVKEGLKVIVQPSNRRAFTHNEYLQAGAVIQEDLSEAPVIIGVKSVPLDYQSLMPNKTYAFFSHTIKAQEENMPLLDTLLERNVRLLDYEKMANPSGKRIVAFGKYAGIVGMINILNGLGIRLLALGHHTPFMHIGPAHNYRSVEMAKQAVRDTGYEISLGNLPKSIGNMVVVFTGSGNVSQGAQDIFRELPFEMVQVDHLPDIVKHGSSSKIYGCVCSRSDHIRHRQTGKFDPEDYAQNPQNYISLFAKKVAPYASVIVNGIYWGPNLPRLISVPDAKLLLREQQDHSPWLESSAGCPQLPHRMLAICDISCDPGGSIEFMKEITTIDKPFCLYDAEQNMSYDHFSGPGVIICAVDNMPAQMPRESTEFFGSLLMPYVYDIMSSDAKQPFDKWEADPIVKNAIITSNGSLTPNFEYIAELRDAKRKQSAGRARSRQAVKHRLLVLGSGHVADVESMASKYNCQPVFADVSSQPDVIEGLIADHSLVVSLLPYRFHPRVLKIFISYCGGLPAPQHSTNPLRYKFSWSPEGALLSTLNASRYLKSGKIVEIPRGGHLMLAAQDIEYFPGFNLEGYPNRDSLHYRDLYGIESAQTLLRGTLRYRGYSNAAWGLIQLGLLSDTPHASLHPEGPDITWKQLLCQLLGKPRDIFVGTLKDAVFAKVGRDREKFQCIEELGLFEDKLIEKRHTPLSSISCMLAEKLKYKPGETDVIIMVLDLSCRFPNGTRENHVISLVKYGDPNGYSAMSLTVGYQTAIAAKMLL